MVPKVGNHRRYCKVCKDDYDDYLEVPWLLFSTLTQARIEFRFLKILIAPSLPSSKKTSNQPFKNRQKNKIKKSYQALQNINPSSFRLILFCQTGNHWQTWKTPSWKFISEIIINELIFFKQLYKPFKIKSFFTRSIDIFVFLSDLIIYNEWIAYWFIIM